MPEKPFKYAHIVAGPSSWTEVSLAVWEDWLELEAQTLGDDCREKFICVA